MIRATSDHKILVLGRGFVAARDLKPGDRIRGAGGTIGITKVTVEGGSVVAETTRDVDDQLFEEDP